MAGMSYGYKYRRNSAKKAFPKNKEGIFQAPNGKWVLRLKRNPMGTVERICSVFQSDDKEEVEKYYKGIKDIKNLNT